jgi:hypothetical protein
VLDSKKISKESEFVVPMTFLVMARPLFLLALGAGLMMSVGSPANASVKFNGPDADGLLAKLAANGPDADGLLAGAKFNGPDADGLVAGFRYNGPDADGLVAGFRWNGPDADGLVADSASA